MLVFRPRTSARLPISLAGCTPQKWQPQSLGQIERTLLWQGNRQLPLAELFDVTGDAASLQWRWEGDFSAVHHLAEGMAAGEVIVDGNIGRHGGRGMTGGELVVQGSAGDYLGAAMQGGRIEVAGNVANYAGAGDVGHKVGMRGGEILIHGSAGSHLGAAMRGGWLTVVGDCGAWTGYRMRAGSVLLFGAAGERPGAGMRRGTIACFGAGPHASATQLLPTFRFACRYRPPALRPMLRALVQREVAQAGEVAPSPEMHLYHGDLLEGGRGEMLVRADW